MLDSVVVRAPTTASNAAATASSLASRLSAAAGGAFPSDRKRQRVYEPLLCTCCVIDRRQCTPGDEKYHRLVVAIRAVEGNPDMSSGAHIVRDIKSHLILTRGRAMADACVTVLSWDGRKEVRPDSLYTRQELMLMPQSDDHGGGGGNAHAARTSDFPAKWFIVILSAASPPAVHQHHVGKSDIGRRLTLSPSASSPGRGARRGERAALRLNHQGTPTANGHADPDPDVETVCGTPTRPSRPLSGGDDPATALPSPTRACTKRLKHEATTPIHERLFFTCRLWDGRWVPLPYSSLHGAFIVPDGISICLHDPGNTLYVYDGNYRLIDKVDFTIEAFASVFVGADDMLSNGVYNVRIKALHGKQCVRSLAIANMALFRMYCSSDVCLTTVHAACKNEVVRAHAAMEAFSPDEVVKNVVNVYLRPLVRTVSKRYVEAVEAALAPQVAPQ